MKTQKVLDINSKIHLVCIRILSVNGYYLSNPYHLYLLYNARDKNGYLTQHRKCIAKYHDMTNILCIINDMFANCVQESPTDRIIAWCKQYHGS